MAADQVESAGPKDAGVRIYHLSRRVLLRNFELVVFHNEFNNRVDGRLRKWVQPVKVYLDLRAGNRTLVTKILERHLQHLAEITGHDIEMVPDKDNANVVVVLENSSKLGQVEHDYFHNGFDIRQVMQTNLCVGRYHSNGRYEIYKATVVIPTDRVMAQHRLTSCIIEETTQILGLPNDSDLVVPSVFNDDTPDVYLTKQDMLLTRILYDPRLTAGMERADALEQVQAILKETVPNGLTEPAAVIPDDIP